MIKNKTLLRAFKRVGTPVYKVTSRISREIASHEHKMLFKAEWCIDNPENFDHYIDQYYLWGKTGTSHWLERGVFNNLSLQMFEEPVILELCCGEGFNTKHFYSGLAKSILACDFDDDAIKEAKKKNSMPNIKYIVKDIRTELPETIEEMPVTNVIWDTAIEHFTEVEIDAIIRQIKRILAPQGGVLSGHTIKELAGGKQLEQHEYEFKSMDDLKRFFQPYFKNVKVIETRYPTRHNFYFWASDGEVPFCPEWKHWS